MKVGIVGAGFWTRFQIAGWKEIPGIEITAIANKTVAKARAIADEFGIPSVYTGANELVDAQRLDCLDIVTAVEAHAETVRLASERHIPVICQKPMATSLEQAREMVRTCEQSGVPFLIHENWRYQATIRAVKAELESGVIGFPFRARIQFSSSFPVFVNQPALKELPQFILTDIGSHILDVARFLFGEAKDLLCRTAKVADIAGEDVATTLMSMQGCPMVACEMSYASRLKDEAFPETFIVIEGSLGSIELVKGRQLYVTTAAGTSQKTIRPPRYPWADPAYDLVHASIVDCNRALAAALRGEQPAETSGLDNLRTVELVFGSYESARLNQKIEIS